MNQDRGTPSCAMIDAGDWTITFAAKSWPKLFVCLVGSLCNQLDAQRVDTTVKGMRHNKPGTIGPKTQLIRSAWSTLTRVL